jgi:hypothetical protein
MKDLSLHILDIAENSVAAGAGCIRICIEELPNEDVYRFVIEDDGSGMAPEFLAQVTEPWVTTRTTRRFGLGLPLLRQNCEQADGSLEIISRKGKGTKIIAAFRFSHIDRPPAGDIPATLRLLMAAHPEIYLVYEHRTPAGMFAFDTRQITNAIGNLPLNHPEVLKLCTAYIRENLMMIGAECQSLDDSRQDQNEVKQTTHCDNTK